MAYTLKSQTWNGHTILHCVMVAEGGSTTSDVVDVTVSGEIPLDDVDYGANPKTVSTGRTWNGRTLATFNPRITSQAIQSWEVNSANRNTLVGPWLSIFLAMYDVQAAIDDPGYGSMFSGPQRGLGVNTVPNLCWVINGAHRTGSQTITTGQKCSLGLRIATNDADSGFWYVPGDGPTAINTLDPMSPAPTTGPQSTIYRLGIQGYWGNNDRDHFCAIALDGKVTGDQFQDLHHDFFGELVSAPAPSGSAAPGLRANPRLILP